MSENSYNYANLQCFGKAGSKIRIRFKRFIVFLLTEKIL